MKIKEYQKEFVEKQFGITIKNLELNEQINNLNSII